MDNWDRIQDFLANLLMTVWLGAGVVVVILLTVRLWVLYAD